MTPEQLTEIEKWLKAGECDPEDMANLCRALREAWAEIERLKGAADQQRHWLWADNSVANR